VILLIYDSCSPESKSRLVTDWLPRLENLNLTVPIILVGNKVDKKSSYAENELQTLLPPIMKRFKVNPITISKLRWELNAVPKTIWSWLTLYFALRELFCFQLAPFMTHKLKKFSQTLKKLLREYFELQIRIMMGT